MSVTRVAVSSQPKIDAAATMNSTTAVVSIVSIETLTSILNVSVRYQTSPRNSAQIDAATAPSVGVKMPVTMPPISSTGVMIGSTASNLNFQSAANSATIATTVADHRIEPGIDRAPDRERERDDDEQLDARLADARPLELDVAAPVVLVREVGDGQHHQRGHHQARA